MRWLKVIAAEAYSLLVDDGSFALSIVVWLGFVWLSRDALPATPWTGVVLFAGLAAILAESALRRSRK